MATYMLNYVVTTYVNIHAQAVNIIIIVIAISMLQMCAYACTRVHVHNYIAMQLHMYSIVS